MPDIRIAHPKDIPVEIKHLNSPRVEHEALANGETYVGSVDKSYDQGLQKKITDFIADAKTKFGSYYSLSKGNVSDGGSIYLYFSKSIDASIVDGIEWEQKMVDRIRAIATPIAGTEILLEVIDIDSIFQTAE
jgi:hypothetical protein